MLLESSSWAEYEYVKIFQKHFGVAKSQEDEKYAVLSQVICVLQIFTDQGFIFANSECMTISMLLRLSVNYKWTKWTFCGLLWEKSMNEFEWIHQTSLGLKTDVIFFRY